MKVLNFAPVRFAEESKAYKLFVLPYKDENYLKSLRDQYNDTNSFFRNGEFIYHSPMVAEGGYREGELLEFHVDRDVDLTKSLIHHILFRSIFQLKVKASSFYPIKFLSNKREDNKIGNLLTETDAQKIAYRLGFIIDTRTLTRQNITHYGVLFNTFFNWDIDINCRDLVGMGLEICEAYVIRKEVFHEAFQPKRSLVGKVVAVEGGIAIVDNEEEELHYPLEELYLENSFGNRERLLGKVLQPFKANQIVRQLFLDGANRMGGPATWANIQRIYDHYKKQVFSNENGFRFKVQRFVDTTNSLWAELQIKSPTYCFGNSDGETDVDRQRGLKNHGPHSRHDLTLNKSLIIVFYRSSSEGRVTEFLAKLKQKFISLYHLGGIEFRYYSVNGDSNSDFEREIIRAIEENSTPKPAMAIVENASDFMGRSPESDPYLFCKAKLLNQGIPSQEIRLETMVSQEQSPYAITNICLAMYAKLGGVPWKIPRMARVHHEVVFGIGHQVFKSGRFGGGNRIVGITTVLSGDGTYLLGNKSKSVKYEEYFEEFKQKLASDFGKIKRFQGWEEGETIRVIFHIFKPFKDEEIEVIKQLVRDLERGYEFKFAFLTFSANHPYFFIDDGQNGVPDKRNPGKTKGKWQPQRNSNLKIDDRQYLLQLTGPNEIKSYTNGYANPLLIRLHESSTFTDMDYLVQQASWFASISWKSVDLSSMPVTISYSNLVANLIGKMTRSGHLDSISTVNPILDFKVWFL